VPECWLRYDLIAQLPQIALAYCSARIWRFRACDRAVQLRWTGLLEVATFSDLDKERLMNLNRPIGIYSTKLTIPTAPKVLHCNSGDDDGTLNPRRLLSSWRRELTRTPFLFL